MAVRMPAVSPQSAREHLDRTLHRIEQYADPAVWIHRLSSEQLDRQLAVAMQRHSAGVPQPLLGLTFAIKDNIDLAGEPTTAACPGFSYTPDTSATVVQRLCDAGAIAVGKTNLDQFATGLVGVRSPFGAVRNPFDPTFIAGGSSSGSAAAVAAGLVDFSLGTDTAGSGRVPAAFCNLVGVKPTRGLVSTAGVVPACRSLDCVSIFANSVAQAQQVLGVASGFDPADPYSRRSDDIPRWTPPTVDSLRIGVPMPSQREFFGDDAAQAAYTRALSRAARIAGTVVAIDFTPFRDAAAMLYSGPWVAERYLACKRLYDTSPQSLLPVTRSIIAKAARFSAADAFAAGYQLQSLRRQTEAQWEKMDALLLPTTGTIYRIAEVEADPIQLNTNLGYYTNFTNLLDLAAVAVPNGFRPDRLPTGVTFIGPAGSDAMLLQLAERFISTPSE